MTNSVSICESSSRAIPDLDATSASQIIESGESWQARLGTSTPPISGRFKNSSFLLRTDQVVGVVRVGSVTIEISPKYLSNSGVSWYLDLSRLIEYGRGVTLSSDSIPIGTQDDSSFLEFIGTGFLSDLEVGRLRGLTRDYRLREETGTFLRGSLDRRKFANLVLQTGRVSSVSSYLSTDTPINNLLGWASRRLASSVASRSVSNKLQRHSSELTESRNPRLPSNWRSIRAPRTFDYLGPLIQTSKDLARTNEVMHNFDESELTFSGFLWRTADLFERAIRRFCADALKESLVRVEKKSFTLLTHLDAPATVTTPDLLFSLPSGKLLIGDAKYKVLGPGMTPDASDTYQVLCGANAVGAHTAILFFPSEGSQIEHKTFNVSGFGVARRLVVARIGLQTFSNLSHIRKCSAVLKDLFLSLWSKDIEHSS